MKKIILIAMFGIITTSAFSQINKGQLLVGGSANFSSSKQNDVPDSKLTTFHFSPDVGYFFIPNLAGGLRASFSSSKYEDEDEAFTSTSVAPFVRYYFLPAEQKVNVFADASYGIGSVGQGDNESFNYFGVMAGPAVFLNEHTALEFAIQYQSWGGDAYNDNRENSFGFNVGFQIHIGQGEPAKKK